MAKIIRLPGLIDIHVHLRDPGQTYKEDFYTGTASALAGGVTAVFDMPNNLAPIFTDEKLQEKIQIAKQKAVCDFGLYFGSIGDNTQLFEKVAPKVAGLKVYLSTTTGKYVVGDEELLERIFQKWPKKKIIIVHAEGDRADLAIKLSAKYKNRLHITHVSTADVLERIIAAKKDKLSVTCDVTPHHLFLTDNNLSKMKSFGIVKPSLATQADVDYLWRNLDKVDCIASDHAPHTIEEKQSIAAPPGMPGLETMLPLLLLAVSQKRVSLTEIIRLTNINPQKIFGFKLALDTFVEIDMEEKYIINNKELLTKCGWSPFDGWKVQGKIKTVYIRGTKVFGKGKVLVQPGFGKNII